jgi:hypothetical protein
MRPDRRVGGGHGSASEIGPSGPREGLSVRALAKRHGVHRRAVPLPLLEEVAVYSLYLDASGTHGASPVYILAGVAVHEQDAYGSHRDSSRRSTDEDQTPGQRSPNQQHRSRQFFDNRRFTPPGTATAPSSFTPPSCHQPGPPTPKARRPAPAMQTTVSCKPRHDRDGLMSLQCPDRH